MNGLSRRFNNMGNIPILRQAKKMESTNSLLACEKKKAIIDELQKLEKHQSDNVSASVFEVGKISEEALRENLQFTPEAVEILVTALRDQFHYVVVDVPRTPAPPYQRALDLADFRIIVCDQTLRSVRDTVRLRGLLGEGDTAHRNLLVINRHGEGGRRAVTLQEMRHVLDLRPGSVIPFQPNTFISAVNNSQVAAAKRGKFADAIGALVLELSGRPPDRRRWWSSKK